MPVSLNVARWGDGTLQTCEPAARCCVPISIRHCRACHRPVVRDQRVKFAMRLLPATAHLFRSLDGGTLRPLVIIGYDLYRVVINPFHKVTRCEMDKNGRRAADSK